jgi:predicted helicase
VVNFIVRAVDDILKTEFDMPQGLADTSKTKIKVNVQGQQIEQEVHKVQILDPATGTGTFLAEAVKHIHQKFQGQQGIWSQYVETHLLPRLNGFELLMASYAMAHLKLDLLLKETGYTPTTNQRFRVYLTNSLEEASQERPNLFMSQWLTEEGQQADAIKRDTPVMCVIGNPPYSVSSNNKSPWIENLVGDYKKDLNERNIQPLSDDYIKFIRFGQYFIEKTGDGVLAYISNNSFIDGIIHRKMREELMQTFDKIYILDLHGNSKKKEIAPDGSADQNVFDIMQGVSINIFIKTGKKKNKEKGKVFHFDLYGKRNDKYDFLDKNSFSGIAWKELEPNAPNFIFIHKDQNIRQEFENGFQLNCLFVIGSNGVQTKRDGLFIDFQKKSLINRIQLLLSGNLTKEFINEFQIEDSSSYPLLRKITESRFDETNIVKTLYRPFDIRSIYYDKNLLGRPFFKTLSHLLNKNNNYCLIIGRQGQAVGGDSWNLVEATSSILDTNLFYRGGNMAYPLYLYPESSTQQTIESPAERTPNLNPEIVNQIAEKLGLTFVPEKNKDTELVEVAPIDILDYIYAVLHSPTYREKYKEFLKIDFPRVPYPKDQETFWQLVQLGGEIRQIHLLESPVVEHYITQYPMNGDNVVVKPRFVVAQPADKIGKVYINDTQYFDHVPQIAWEFYIGGYQPAQKWLKDRKDRKLEFEDILHYQKIIVALTETDRLMKEIDTINIE